MFGIRYTVRLGTSNFARRAKLQDAILSLRNKLAVVIGFAQDKSISLKVAEFTVGYRKLLTLAACLFTLVLASGILRSSFDTSLGALLTRSDPYLEELDLLEAEFPSADKINFAFIAIEDDSVFSKAVLDAIVELRDGFDAIPYAVRLTSLIDYYSPETRRRLFDSPLTDF